MSADKLKEFDEWIDVTGALAKGTSWWAECRSIVEDAQAEIDRLQGSSTKFLLAQNLELREQRAKLTEEVERANAFANKTAEACNEVEFRLAEAQAENAQLLTLVDSSRKLAERYKAALKLCVTEIGHLIHQVKCRPGGSVDRAYKAGLEALNAPGASEEKK